MKSKNTLCQRLGIKMQDMADYLDVSIHMMSQYETDKRNLPPRATLKLAQLELLLLNTDQTNPVDYEPLFSPGAQLEKLKKHLHRQSSLCQAQLYKAEKKLLQMQEKYGQSIQLLQVMVALDAGLPEGEADKHWAHIMQRKAIKILEQNGPPAQTRLRLRISGLRQLEKDIKNLLQNSDLLEKLSGPRD